jgi:hypothetical protein
MNRVFSAIFTKKLFCNRFSKIRRGNAPLSESNTYALHKRFHILFVQHAAKFRDGPIDIGLRNVKMSDHADLRTEADA